MKTGKKSSEFARKLAAPEDFTEDRLPKEKSRVRLATKGTVVLWATVKVTHEATKGHVFRAPILTLLFSLYQS